MCFIVKEENFIRFMPGDVFKNLKKLQLVRIQNNVCVSRDFEMSELQDFVDVAEASCTDCEINDDDYKMCTTLKKLGDEQERLHNYLESKLHTALIQFKNLYGSIKLETLENEKIATKFDSDLKKKSNETEQMFENKFEERRKEFDVLKNEELEKIKTDLDNLKVNEFSKFHLEIEELKKNHEANVSDWESYEMKVTILFVLAFAVICIVSILFVTKKFFRMREDEIWGELSTETLQK